MPASLNDGRFHRHLQDIFAPLVVRYVDLMESSIGQSIHKGFEKESWKNKGYAEWAFFLYITSSIVVEAEPNKMFKQ